MPLYLIKRATRLAHNGQLLQPGDVADIQWPEGAAPTKLGDNMEEVKSEADARKVANEEAKAVAAKKADAKARGAGNAAVLGNVGPKSQD